MSATRLTGAALLILLALFLISARIASAQTFCSEDPEDEFCIGDFPPEEDRVCTDSYYVLGFPESPSWTPFSDFEGWPGREIENSFYCSWLANSAMFELMISRIAITESMGFGFSMEQLTPAGAPSNVMIQAFYRRFGIVSAFVTADVDGAEIGFKISGVCFNPVSSACDYWITEVELGAGWVGANGIDLGHRTLNLGPILPPPHFTGYGVSLPFGFDGAPFFADPFLPGGSHEGEAHQITPQRDIRYQLEDFFGITFEIDFERETAFSAVPEPGTLLMLTWGAAGVAVLGRMRRSHDVAHELRSSERNSGR